jgi:molybdopterin synthase catalytic subunit
MKTAMPIWSQEGLYEASKSYMKTRPVWRQGLYEDRKAYMKLEDLHENSKAYMKPAIPIWRQEFLYEASNSYM